MFIENISIIFEEDNKERLLSIATYFFAIIERSPEKIKQAVEELEFTIQTKIMSTLALLQEKGIEIGTEKGEYKKSVLSIRNMTLKKLDTALIAEFSANPLVFVKKVQKELKLETKIIVLLSKKQTTTEIAKKLNVNEWLVEVIRELKTTKI